MLIAAGVDIGSTAAKAALLVDGRPAAMVVGPSSTNPGRTARSLFEQACAAAGVRPQEVACVVGTGYGRARVDFAAKNISEITCHGRGAHFIRPSVRTIVDIGGQDTKVISIDGQGGLLDFAMNDKCAAGTGRFLEAMARSMEIPVAEMSRFFYEPGDPATITSMCSVFAESEVINLINDGAALPSIVKGLLISLAGRVASLAARLGVVPEVAMSGGVAKSPAVREVVARKLGVTLLDFGEVDPQMIGALGAGLIASELAAAAPGGR